MDEYANRKHMPNYIQILYHKIHSTLSALSYTPFKQRNTIVYRQHICGRLFEALLLDTRKTVSTMQYTVGAVIIKSGVSQTVLLSVHFSSRKRLDNNNNNIRVSNIGVSN